MLEEYRVKLLNCIGNFQTLRCGMLSDQFRVHSPKCNPQSIPDGRQAPSCYQIIQRTLADGEQLRCLMPAQEQLLFNANYRLPVAI